MALKLGPDVHQLVGLGIRQWRQQRRVGHGEDRRVRADAKRQRENCDGREARTLAKHSYRETKILQQSVEPSSCANGSHFFFYRLDTPNSILATRRASSGSIPSRIFW